MAAYRLRDQKYKLKGVRGDTHEKGLRPNRFGVEIESSFRPQRVVAAEIIEHRSNARPRLVFHSMSLMPLTIAANPGPAQPKPLTVDNIRRIRSLLACGHVLEDENRRRQANGPSTIYAA